MVRPINLDTALPMNKNEAFSLVPEEHLLNEVSPIWQQRFERALNVIYNNIEHPQPWNQVAAEAAISPHHFHRMFQAVFGETPGQYTRRLRLGMAFTMLLDENSLSITDIALQCGFSSSQALAKAMKRDLGFSPSQIRAMPDAEDGEDEEIEKLVHQLSHPQNAIPDNIEDLLASTIPFQIKEFDTRQYRMEYLLNPSESKLRKTWKQLQLSNSSELVAVTSNSELLKPLSQIKSHVGVECPATQANLTLNGATFLYCRIRVSSEGGYLVAWDALYKHLLTLDVEPDDQGVTLDIIHNPETLGKDICEMTLALQLSN
jgi:AraC family transcriptional regulator